MQGKVDLRLFCRQLRGRNQVTTSTRRCIPQHHWNERRISKHSHDRLFQCTALVQSTDELGLDSISVFI